MATLCRLLLIAAVLLATLTGGLLMLYYPLPGLAVILFAAWPRGRIRPVSGSHGTARFATHQDLTRRGLFGTEGLAVGRASLLDPPTWQQALQGLFSLSVGSAEAVRMMRAAFGRGFDDSVIRIHDFVHAITFAPTGAGKGIYIQIPNLFTYLGSMVVVDPQGTLFKVTAWFRQKILGHKIIKMDPLGFTGPAEESDCLNPCDFIDEKSETFIDEIRSLVDLLVKREPNEFQPHFNEWAIIVLSSMLCFICGCEADAANRSLNVMRDLVGSRKGFTDAMEAMQQVPGLVAKMGAMLSIPLDKELSAILSTVQRHTAWMDSPPVAANLSRSTWDPRLLWSGKVTVYLILPSTKLTTLSPLLRLWVGTILNVVTQKGASEKNKILFMIDEAAHIGKIQVLEDAMTLLRAYGIRIWLFFQSMNQLQKCYGENAQTMIENASIRQFFGTVAFESADYISKNVGDCTILVESINRNRSRSWQTGLAARETPETVSTGGGTTISETGRRLLKPEEILVLPEDVSLTFYKNLPVIPTQLVPYFADPAFNHGRSGRSWGRKRAAGVYFLVAIIFGLVGLLAALRPPVPGRPQQPALGPPRLDGGTLPSPPANPYAPSSKVPARVWPRPPSPGVGPVGLPPLPSANPYDRSFRGPVGVWPPPPTQGVRPGVRPRFPPAIRRYGLPPRRH